jgi:hypothetical protein
MSALVEGRKQAARIKERTEVHTPAGVIGSGWLDWVQTDTNRASKSRSESRSRLPRGCFTRQPVNVASLEALTKVRPVRLPVSSRQVTRQVSSCSPHLMTPPPSLKPKFRIVARPQFHAPELLPGNMRIKVTNISSRRNRAVHVGSQVGHDGTARKWKRVTAVNRRPGSARMPDSRSPPYSMYHHGPGNSSQPDLVVPPNLPPYLPLASGVKSLMIKHLESQRAFQLATPASIEASISKMARNETNKRNETI